MNLFKKFVLVAVVLGVVAFSAPQADASMLSNLKKEVEALKAQVARLSLGLAGAVQLSSEKDYSSCDGKYYAVATKEGTTYWCEGEVESEIEYKTEYEKIEESKEEESKDEATTEDEKDMIGGTRWRIDSEGCSLYYDWNSQTWVKSNPTCPKKENVKVTVPVVTNNSSSTTAQITLPLIRGSYGDQVIRLQEILKSLGYFTGDTGPAFGPKTEQAIKDFQKANGLGNDGKVGPNTRKFLNEKAGGTSLGGTGTTPPALVCKPSTAPYIKVIAPNGGETYTSGQQITVKWSSCNLPITDPIKINIGYYGPGSLNPTAQNLLITTNNYTSATVTLPTLPDTTGTGFIAGNYYKMFVSDPNTAPTVVDKSDNLFTINNSQITNNVLGQISMWYGKVNQHRSPSGEWMTDPDGTAGAGNYTDWGNDGWGDRKVQYCQRFWPDTTSVEEAGTTDLPIWHGRGNIGDSLSVKPVFNCLD